MGRKVVVELTCDRCGRTEHNASDGRPAGDSIFTCTFKGKELSFTDLCSSCVEVVATHIADIVREMKKVSPIRSNATRTSAMEKVGGKPPTAPATPPKVPVPEKSVPHGTSQRP